MVCRDGSLEEVNTVGLEGRLEVAKKMGKGRKTLLAKRRARPKV